MTNPFDKGLSGKAAVVTGAAIGSAAIAAAVLFARRYRERTPKSAPPHPERAPETD